MHVDRNLHLSYRLLKTFKDKILASRMWKNNQNADALLSAAGSLFLKRCVANTKQRFEVSKATP